MPQEQLARADGADVGGDRKQRRGRAGADRGGADLDVRSKGGFTPLLFAVRAARSTRPDVLLTAGANVNETLPDGTSALVLAIDQRALRARRRLLDRGADPNADAQGGRRCISSRGRAVPTGASPIPGRCRPERSTAWTWSRQLAAHGANPNARQTKEPKDGYRNLLNRIGATPFLLAAKVGRRRADAGAGGQRRRSAACRQRITRRR